MFKIARDVFQILEHLQNVCLLFVGGRWVMLNLPKASGKAFF